MDPAASELDLPPSWREALAAAEERRRVIVLGGTDMGKTTFIRAGLGAGGIARLIDLDPGQKMIGPPGTVGVGRLERAERLIFIGTTSSSAFSAIARAAAELAEGAEPFIVNTSGFVKGIGARLQAMTIKAVEPDLIVEIGCDSIAVGSSAPVLRIERSPLARRKSTAFRAALRQAALDRKMEGASLLPIESTAIEPGPLGPWDQPARPVCSLADRDGRDLALGIVERSEEGRIYVRSRAPAGEVSFVRLGKMWAEPKEGRWRLLDKLIPSWVQA